MMQEIEPSLQDGASPVDRVRAGFSHASFVYSTSQEFLTGTVPFLQGGLEAGEQVLALLPHLPLRARDRCTEQRRRFWEIGRDDESARAERTLERLACLRDKEGIT